MKEGERVLEIGLGTGQCIISVVNLVGDSGRVYGIDVAAHILPNYIDCCPTYVEKALEEAGFHPVDAVTMPMWGLPVEIVGVKKV